MQFKVSREDHSSKSRILQEGYLHSSSVFLSMSTWCLLYLFIVVLCLICILAKPLFVRIARKNESINYISILCYINGLNSIMSLNLLYMPDHHIWCFNQICTQWELVHFGGYIIGLYKGNEITWRQGFLLNKNYKPCMVIIWIIFISTMT